MSWTTDVKALTQDAKCIPEKLQACGFTESEKGFVSTMPVMQGQFVLRVTVDGCGSITTQMTDTVSGEEYTLYRNDAASGSFVGEVRGACMQALKNIVSSCYEQAVFHSAGANSIIRYAEKAYGDRPEFLWKGFPHDAVIRRPDNEKWYVLLVRLPYRSLGVSGAGECDIADLQAYHMNKKNWYTAVLDGEVSDDTLRTLVDRSYTAAAGKKTAGRKKRGTAVDLEPAPDCIVKI